MFRWDRGLLPYLLLSSTSELPSSGSERQWIWSTRMQRNKSKQLHSAMHSHVCMFHRSAAYSQRQLSNGETMHWFSQCLTFPESNTGFVVLIHTWTLKYNSRPNPPATNPSIQHLCTWLIVKWVSYSACTWLVLYLEAMYIEAHYNDSISVCYCTAMYCNVPYLLVWDRCQVPGHPGKLPRPVELVCGQGPAWKGRVLIQNLERNKQFHVFRLESMFI